MIELFESDFAKYSFVEINNLLIEQARKLVYKYGNIGLRTLDGIQLASSISLAHKVDLFYTNDKILKSIFVLEGLPTK